ncbi:MAG: hypothetical protein R3A50_12690 [Saprospiraceae bacterium]|nr:hypothetical protein [Lewinellaceae bacterium]
MSAWSWVTLHRLQSHHEHKGMDCSAYYDGHSTHVHDDRYTNEHCFLCAFLLNSPAIISITQTLVSSHQAFEYQNNFQCDCSLHRYVLDTTFLRGPPVL